jgi:hypothetical protein
LKFANQVRIRAAPDEIRGFFAALRMTASNCLGDEVGLAKATEGAGHGFEAGLRVEAHEFVIDKRAYPRG